MGRGLRLKLFAALLLRAMAQEQAEEGTEGVSPRHPNVARRLGLGYRHSAEGWERRPWWRRMLGL
jgi:hypothetical protein